MKAARERIGEVMSDDEPLLVDTVAEAIYRYAAHWFQEESDFNNAVCRSVFTERALDIIEMVDEIRADPRAAFLRCSRCEVETFHCKEIESMPGRRFCVLCGSQANKEDAIR